ncbi:hypothetical protein BHE74_00045442 [Ensete ventricosum]|nr:hypothetical protein BHE74_00045442 [Ensete ventricosum]
MRLGTRLECIRSSPRVSGACQDDTREFTEGRPRLTGRLSGVAEILAGSWEVVVSPRWRLYHPDQQLHYHHLGFKAAFGGYIARTPDFLGVFKLLTPNSEANWGL